MGAGRSKNLKVQKNIEMDIDCWNDIDSKQINKNLHTVYEQSRSIFKIIKDNEKIGNGFLCKIPSPDSSNLIPVLITCYHILKPEDLFEGNEITIKFNNEEIKNIKINNKINIYTSDKKEYDIIIIEIKPKEDCFHLNNFLEIDNNIYKEDLLNIYKEQKNIYIIQYPEGLKNKLTSGTIQSIDANNYGMQHLCLTEKDSSGCPIFNLNNFKVIGIHKGDHKKNEFKDGVVLRGAIDLFNTYKDIENEIVLYLEINEKDINKKIYFLDNTDYIDEETGKKHYHDNLKELSESNVNLYIQNNNDEKQYKFKKFFIPNEKGLYSIRLKFKKLIKDCSYMFYECYNIKEINFSSFDTKNVTEMSGMFYRCKNLKKLNLSTFDTSNVTNMCCMFLGCINLIEINLSSFDTKKVTDMSGMFLECQNLKEINLSKFDTTNVTDMGGMFFRCKNLKELNLLSFDTKNVINLNKIFDGCYNLKKIKSSSENKNLTNMIDIFFWCETAE